MNIQESPKFNWKKLLWSDMNCLGFRSSGKMVWWAKTTNHEAHPCLHHAGELLHWSPIGKENEQGSTPVVDPPAAGQRLLKNEVQRHIQCAPNKIQLLLWSQNRLNSFAKQIFCSSTVEFPVCGVTWCHKTRGPAHSIAFPSLLSTWWQ